MRTTAWDSEASGSYQTTLPGETGKYYLTDNVKLSDTWKPANGTVLCLNVHSITAVNLTAAITVDSNVTFTLTDCNGSGSTDMGGGVFSFIDFTVSGNAQITS